MQCSAVQVDKVPGICDFDGSALCRCCVSFLLQRRRRASRRYVVGRARSRVALGALGSQKPQRFVAGLGALPHAGCCAGCLGARWDGSDMVQPANQPAASPPASQPAQSTVQQHLAQRSTHTGAPSTHPLSHPPPRQLQQGRPPRYGAKSKPSAQWVVHPCALMDHQVDAGGYV